MRRIDPVVRWHRIWWCGGSGPGGAGAYRPGGAGCTDLAVRVRAVPENEPAHPEAGVHRPLRLADRGPHRET
ncbi:hypothetical protein [Streptomyces sp. NPDC096311]|uniref:hypothetical protein n=1 Tax=Streptomyces sp. NPDC096311 TaxID=3366083 RepID=UPI0038230CC7